MREAALEAKFDRKVRAAGGITRKWSSPSRRGVLDRIVIWPGNVVHFVELKTYQGTLSMLQHVEIQTLRNMGCKTFVLYGWANCEAYIEDYAGAEA